MKILLNLRMMLLVLASLFIAQTASAESRCVSWGCATVTQWGITQSHMYIKGTTDDKKEDGYCVYIRYRLAGESWPARSGGSATKSCGAPKSFDIDSGSYFGAVGIRLYRENGNYTTIYGN